jgi:2-polyprenyl-3-methyl-5-hydroxy-6-metoxy-1,4-benzoquinol methylase
MNVVETLCIICGSSKDKSELIYTEFNLNIVRCLNCGLVYVNPRLAEEELDVIYGRNKNLSHGEQVREDKTPDPEIYVKYETKLANKRLKNVAKLRKGKLGRVLDIGSQHGHFLNLAQTVGWEPVGVEMTTEFAENSRKEYGFIIYNDKVENVNFTDTKFDFVTMFDVLEHVQYPNSVLQKINNIMQDDGILMIRLPNVNFIFLKMFVLTMLFGKDAHTKYDFVNPLGYCMAQEHLYNFSDRTLQKLLAKHGFKKRKSYMEFPSIYGGNKWRDVTQVFVWGMSVVLYTLTFGKINISRSLVYVFVKI